MTRLLKRWGYCAVLIAAIRYFDGDSASTHFHGASGADPRAVAARVPFRRGSKPRICEVVNQGDITKRLNSRSRLENGISSGAHVGAPQIAVTSSNRRT